jgi:hypothetical protein
MKIHFESGIKIHSGCTADVEIAFFCSDLMAARTSRGGERPVFVE